MATKPSKWDNFFGEINDAKKTVIYGVVTSVASIFILPYALYSIGMLMGIYGAYHSFRQKKWGFFVLNLGVSILALVIKITLHKD